ncbi:uncharacterized protein [Rutidosis leptorrhynchoides]|uniref:uncharacterized protein n=1 Tax=Rutidosis leptorrhynchoides TaxID=125765 RepID=UPI003A992EC8
MTGDEAKKSNDVISGTFSINSKPVRVLFDSGASRSFISLLCADKLNVSKSNLESPLEAEIAYGKTFQAVYVYKNYEVDFGSTISKIDLIPMNFGEFDVIIGMDCLDHNRADIACHDKCIRLRTLSGGELIICSEKRRRHVPICTYVRARRLLTSGCVANLVHVVDVQEESLSIKSILVVCDFEDVFLKDLPGVPPERQVEFHMDLVPGANLIAKTRYHLAQTEMQELISQT